MENMSTFSFQANNNSRDFLVQYSSTKSLMSSKLSLLGELLLLLLLLVNVCNSCC